MLLSGLLARAFIFAAIASLLAAVAFVLAVVEVTGDDESVQAASFSVVDGGGRVTLQESRHVGTVSDDAATSKQRSASPFRQGAENELLLAAAVLLHLADQIVLLRVEVRSGRHLHGNHAHLVVHAFDVEGIATRSEEGRNQLAVVAPQDDRLAVHGKLLVLVFGSFGPSHEENHEGTIPTCCLP